jgi:adenosylmethionine-8-amino-7-oxononanoate aminotransferase
MRAIQVGGAPISLSCDQSIQHSGELHVTNSEPPDWLSPGLRHIWLPYAQMKTAAPPLPVCATRGTRLILEDGRELIDGVASWWTAVHGYNHPALIAAARAQLEALPHVMLGGLANEPAYRLATKLAELTPGDLSRAFFSESGSVSVEVAMKIAVQYQAQTGHPERNRFVAFYGGYHGDTLATMAACDPADGMHARFAGVLPAQHIARLPETPELEAELDRLMADAGDIAGVLVEPLIQGAGGMRMHAPETLRALRRLCDKHGALLIFDEIFSGMGRTGSLFAAEEAGVTPDIMTVSKALTGGVAPLAATIATSRVFDAFWSDEPGHALMHGPTYSGHALGCAVALASLSLFETEPRLAQVRAIEARLADGLRDLADLAHVREVRVRGAVGAVELDRPFDREAMRTRFIEAGVFIRPLDRVIYLTPSYVIEASDLHRLIEAVRREALAVGDAEPSTPDHRALD